jgi:hypothetical protein
VRPGRDCPLSYRYGAAAISTTPALDAEVLYVAGGLYGNRAALDAILERASRERRCATLVFNGDFNWFNVDAEGIAAVNDTVLRHAPLRGNVETEMAGEDEGAGCGCAYPDGVSDAEVGRSNAIIARLRESARSRPALRALLADLPMFLAARIAGVRIGIVHGDGDALAGWGFSQEVLGEPRGRAAAAEWFNAADVRVFASSHTCLPVMQSVATPRGPGLVANNGAAGMPNFQGTRHGLITRIAADRAPEALYGTWIEGVRVEALPVAYDHERFLREFLANWPPESPAHVSYLSRILNGPRWLVEDARRAADGVP